MIRSVSFLLTAHDLFACHFPVGEGHDEALHSLQSTPFCLPILLLLLDHLLQ
jgi:hypothetical protein